MAIVGADNVQVDVTEKPRAVNAGCNGKCLLSFSKSASFAVWGGQQLHVQGSLDGPVDVAFGVGKAARQVIARAPLRGGRGVTAKQRAMQPPMPDLLAALALGRRHYV